MLTPFLWGYYPFLGRFSKLRKATISVVMSVRPSAQNNSAPTGQIFLKFYIRWYFENSSRKFRCHESRTRITGTLHEDQFTVLIMHHSFFLRMRSVWDKSCRENQNTNFVFSNFFFSLWENVEKYCRAGQATDDNMAYTHCMVDT